MLFNVALCYNLIILFGEISDRFYEVQTNAKAFLIPGQIYIAYVEQTAQC